MDNDNAFTTVLPRTESPVCLRHGLLFVQPDASAADISAQQIGGVIIPQAFSQALQDGRASRSIFISPVARVARTISESAALLSGWMMDGYASEKYSWKSVEITPVSANKLDSS